MLVQVREYKQSFMYTPGIHTQAQKRLEPHVSKAVIIWTGTFSSDSNCKNTVLSGARTFTGVSKSICSFLLVTVILALHLQELHRFELALNFL